MSDATSRLNKLGKLSLRLNIIGILLVFLSFWLFLQTSYLPPPVTAAVLSLTYWYYAEIILLAGLIILVVSFVIKLLSCREKMTSKSG